MPEGPEVWDLTKHMRAVALREDRRCIKHAQIVSGKYTRKGIPNIELLKDATINDLTCKGKLIIIQVSTKQGPKVILSTLGMTGHWRFVSRDFKHVEVKHARLRLCFEDGDLVFQDPRNFGTFTIVDPEQAVKKIESLGADLMRSVFFVESGVDEFIKRARRYGKKTSLAELLLDQRVVAGCGNYIRAEAMFYARVSPLRAVADLTDDELKAVWQGMIVCSTASIQNVHMYSDRKPFEFTVYSRLFTEDGLRVEAYKDKNDRTVWWVPKAQI